MKEVLGAPDVPDHARHALETAHRNSLRLLKVVHTLLEFSRIESGRVQASYTSRVSTVLRLTAIRAPGYHPRWTQKLVARST